MRLRVVNATHYDTRDLRAIISAGLRAHGDDRRYTVHVGYTRSAVGRGSSGYAYYNSGSIKMRLGRRDAVTGKPATEVPPYAVRDFALVLAHEITHTYGVRHSDMDCCLKRRHRGGTDDAPTPWADGLRIRAKAPKAAPVAGAIVAERSAHALAMLDKWTRRQKAATNKVRRWKRAVTYYERKAAASGGA